MLVGAAAALVVVASAAMLLGRDSAGGLGGVSPNAVGIIDPSANTIVAEVPVGIRPGPIAGGDGSVLVGNLDDRTLTKIDGAQSSVSGTIPLDNRTPTGIAVGQGSVWVAHGLLGEISLVDPQFGQVTRTTQVAGTAFGAPDGSVAVDSRSVWAAFGDSTLARLNLVGDVLGEGTAGSRPAGIVVATDSVWVTNSADATVQRFNAETFRQGPLRTFNVGAQPTGIIFSDGSIWVANAALPACGASSRALERSPRSMSEMA